MEYYRIAIQGVCEMISDWAEATILIREGRDEETVLIREGREGREDDCFAAKT